MRFWKADVFHYSGAYTDHAYRMCRRMMSEKHSRFRGTADRRSQQKAKDEEAADFFCQS